jgi:hypothetical protein
MNPTVTTLLQQIDDRDAPLRHSAENVSFSQAEKFFHLAALKGSRSAALRRHFATAGLTKVFLGANINGFGCTLPGSTVQYLSKGFFQEEDEAARERNRALIEDAVVIVNNNDVGHNNGMAGYADFYNRCDKTIFVAWDWDNHHWLSLSTFLASHCDLYAPAHHENLFLLSRYNAHIAGPVYCSTVQWSREFLARQLPQIITTERSNEPLGKHIPYAPFTYRNRVVSTLNQTYPSIGFSDRSFHVRTPEERLKEWMAHKVHWIVPVLNDVAIRIFDALITGGIPLVPESMRLLPPIHRIGRRNIEFYGPDDIMDPRPLVARANALFDAGGADMIAERQRYALDHHHGDRSMRDIMACVNELFGRQP